MSSTRSRQSLGGNHCLSEDPVAKLRFEGGQRDELNRSSNRGAKLRLSPYPLFFIAEAGTTSGRIERRVHHRGARYVRHLA